VHVAKRARLRAVAEDGEVLARDGLGGEGRDDAAVVDAHARTVGVEDAGELDAGLVHPRIARDERFRVALGLVVAGPWSARVHVPEVTFLLRMLEGIAV